MEDTNRYRVRKRQRRRHLDRLEWLMQKSFQLSYGIAVVGTVLVLYDTYPWWAILLGLPLVLIASLGFAGFVWMPFTVPIVLYQWVIDRIYAEEKSGDDIPLPEEDDEGDR